MQPRVDIARAFTLGGTANKKKKPDYRASSWIGWIERRSKGERSRCCTGSGRSDNRRRWRRTGWRYETRIE